MFFIGTESHKSRSQNLARFNLVLKFDLARDLRDFRNPTWMGFEPRTFQLLGGGAASDLQQFKVPGKTRLGIKISVSAFAECKHSDFYFMFQDTIELNDLGAIPKEILKRHNYSFLGNTLHQ